MKTKTDAISWLIALTLAGLMTWSAYRHHMPILQTLTIGLSVAFTLKAAAEHFVRVAATVRNGASR